MVRALILSSGLQKTLFVPIPGGLRVESPLSVCAFEGRQPANDNTAWRDVPQDRTVLVRPS